MTTSSQGTPRVPGPPDSAAPRPLAGRLVLLSRPRDQAAPMARRLAELGAEVMIQPAIQIGDPPDWAPVDAALAQLDRYDWLVFSSANGVRYLLDRLCRIGGDPGRLHGLKLAAIGPATAEELRQYDLQADLVPEEYRAEALARQLIDHCGHGSPTDPGHAIRGPAPRFLLARATRGREVLAEQLSAAGAEVDQVVVYSSTDVKQPEEEVSAAMAAGRIDWVTVTSSAIAQSLVAMFGDQLRRSKLASISPITTETLRQLGHQPAGEATEYTSEGLIAAILTHR